MITIIGAGPVGSHAARLLARTGKEVLVVEEHGAIGRPVQCTGIVTKSISEIVRLRDEFVVNRLRKVRLHAPDKSYAEARINDIVIDRTRFDRHLADKAIKSGAKVILNNRASAVQEKDKIKKLKVTDPKTKKARVIHTDILIGADGPNSIVSKYIGNNKPDFWVGVQAVVDMPVEKKTYEVYFGNEIPGFFGWVVPENRNRARVGIATTRNPKQVFERFMKRFGKHRVIEMQGGLIPKYDPKLRVQQGTNYIVGDAATQVKATTGGGLVPGLHAAECLARSINKGTEYKKELRYVEKELKMSLLLRSMLDRFNEKDYSRLVSIAGSGSIKKILDKEDRDRPSRIVFKSVIKEPRLLLFAKTLLRAKRL